MEYVSTNLGMPRMANHHLELKERHGADTALELQKEHSPTDTSISDFQLVDL